MTRWSLTEENAERRFLSHHDALHRKAVRALAHVLEKAAFFTDYYDISKTKKKY